MFYLRLNKVKILNNREMIGKAEIQFMSFINRGEEDFPMLGDFFKTTDQNKREELMKEAVEKVISSRIMTPVEKVKDKQVLYFGDTGYIVYKSDKIPVDFNWMLMAIELDEKTRSNASMFQEIMKDVNISDVANNIAKLANAANPVSTAAVELVETLANVVTNWFKNDKDDQAGLYMASFIREVDYPNGIRNKEDVSDLTGNMFIDYTIFGHNG